MTDQPSDFFFEVSTPLLTRPDVATGTMMGLRETRWTALIEEALAFVSGRS